MNKYLIIFILIITPSIAQVVQTEGSYTYGGDISRNEGCELAKERAKLKALERVLGQTISSEEMENCSEVDGKTNCERNQFFLSSFNGDILSPKVLSENVKTEKISNSNEEIYICEIRFQANVVKNTQLLDPSFDFNVKLNEKNFRDGEELKIDIQLNKPIYLSIFQILPYEKKDYQVYKLFPNDFEKENFIQTKNLSLPNNIKYKIFFPPTSNKNSIDEYLLFIGSEENIDWLDKYAQIEDLKKAYIKEKGLKYSYKEYTIYK